MEEGCRTPRHSASRILSAVACPGAPKKKAAISSTKKKVPPKNVGAVVEIAGFEMVQGPIENDVKGGKFVAHKNEKESWNKIWELVRQRKVFR
ncbi:hypothetical protein RYX36_006355 [Vicia faba]